ncbi:MAG: hypothetical protein SPK87_01190, partial [Bacteroidales bacterium]|nr:hypothetical protein [Bacteroidales bacterium]
QQNIVPASPAVNEEVDVTVQRNEFGLLDGTVRRTKHEEQEATATSGNMLVDEERRAKVNTQDAADFVPQKGVVYDASAQPNGMGAKNMTVVKRTAKPAIEAKEWTDTQRTATRTVVYDNKIVVFRNQEEVPDFSGWETCSPSISINEFGLLDGVLHLRRLVSDESSGGGGGAGEAGTMKKKKRTVTKYYQKKDGKTYYRNYTATYNCYWGGGAAWLAKQMADAKAKDYPELGFVSGMRGGIMTVYTDVQPGEEQGPLSEKKS